MEESSEDLQQPVVNSKGEFDDSLLEKLNTECDLDTDEKSNIRIMEPSQLLLVYVQEDPEIDDCLLEKLKRECDEENQVQIVAPSEIDDSLLAKLNTECDLDIDEQNEIEIVAPSQQDSEIDDSLLEKLHTECDLDRDEENKIKIASTSQQPLVHSKDYSKTDDSLLAKSNTECDLDTDPQNKIKIAAPSQQPLVPSKENSKNDNSLLEKSNTECDLDINEKNNTKIAASSQQPLVQSKDDSKIDDSLLVRSNTECDLDTDEQNKIEIAAPSQQPLVPSKENSKNDDSLSEKLNTECDLDIDEENKTKTVASKNNVTVDDIDDNQSDSSEDSIIIMDTGKLAPSSKQRGDQPKSKDSVAIAELDESESPSHSKETSVSANNLKTKLNELSQEKEKTESKEIKAFLQKCDRCDFYFLTKFFSQNHLPCYADPIDVNLLKLNTGLSKSEASIELNGFFSCVYCVRKFRGTAAMKLHLTCAHPHRNAHGLCIKCNQVTDDFQSHIHNEDTSIKNERESLSTYFNTELSNRNFYFNCLYCNRKFSSTRSILNHQLLEHSSQPVKYHCLSCMVVFRGPLEEAQNPKHIRSCSVETSAKCARCGEYILMESERMIHESVCNVDLQPITITKMHETQSTSSKPLLLRRKLKITSRKN